MTTPSTPVANIDEHRYVFDDQEHDAEWHRLGLLESLYDSHSLTRLETTGVTDGWRCLEIGAGRGSVARWLAQRVGSSGRVVAADLNPRFLTDLPANVEVRQLDIRTDDVETGSYDLVHCRALLMHLPDPRTVLARMVSALKPGGWLVAEEPDFGLHWLSGHPDAVWANDLFHDVLAMYLQQGIADPYFGRKLPGLVAECGLDAFGGEATSTVAHDEEPALEFQRCNLRAVRHQLVDHGFAERDLERQLAVFDSPSIVLSAPITLVAAWGRKPT